MRTPDQAPPLIFQWKRERGVKRRLAMWVLVVAAGHAALFYLFRVSPPLASRKAPPQQSVLYLPPGEPGVQELLSSLDDRFPGALRVPVDYDLTADTAALTRAVPRLPSSWDARLATLKPFPQPVVPQDLPSLFLAGQPVLPPPDSEPGESGAVPAALPPVGGARHPSLVMESGGTSRAVSAAPRWPDKLMDDWPESGSVPFMLGINRGGAPEYCLPLAPATANNIDQDAIRRALLTMRFSPDTTTSLEWISVSVRW